MQRCALITFLTLLACLLTAGAASAQFQYYFFTGSLSSEAGQIDGTGFWINDNFEPDWHGVTITWEVERNVTDGSWNYKYILEVYRADVSHVILETSDDFTGDDLWNLNTGTPTIGLQNPGAGNPSMPDSIYGFKLDDVSGTYLVMEFDSPRSPVWGDFYAKCGRVGGTQNTAWNVGFTNPDADPDPWVYAPSSGSINNHILVPDTSGEPVPEPATMSLMGIGLATLTVLRRRKR